MGKGIVRDSSNRRFRCQGVLARRALTFLRCCGQAGTPGPVLAKTLGAAALTIAMKKIADSHAA
jgi:hypothetical protein